MREKGYGLYLTSDFPPPFVRLWERYESFKLFDGRAVSYEIRGSKKDLRLFRYLLETYGLNPDECLFVDDLESLTKNAESCAIHGHTFRGTEELRRYLESVSIL